MSSYVDFFLSKPSVILDFLLKSAFLYEQCHIFFLAVSRRGERQIPVIYIKS